MNKLKKLNSQVITFIFIVLLLIIYKSLDNFSKITDFFFILFETIKPFITAFVIAYILNMPCKSIEKLLNKSRVKYLKKYSRGISILIVYILAILIITVTVRSIVPAIYENILDLYKNAAVYIEQIVAYINMLLDDFEFIISLESITTALLNYITKIDVTEFSKYAQGVISFTSGVMNSFISIIASVYMLIDSRRIIRSLKRFIAIFSSEETSDKISDFFKRINDIFSKYIYCKLLEGTIVGIIATIILNIIGVKYALVLGIFIGILNLIPYFGSIISTICVVLITLVTGGIYQALWTLVSLIVLEQVDGNIIGPKILNNVLEIRPLWVIFAVTVFGSLFGVVGMLLSVPVMVVVKMIAKEFLENKEKLKNYIKIDEE